MTIINSDKYATNVNLRRNAKKATKTANPTDGSQLDLKD